MGSSYNYIYVIKDYYSNQQSVLLNSLSKLSTAKRPDTISKSSSGTKARSASIKVAIRAATIQF
jgi:acetylornithine/succinyldiaminopimelate/putrescine aminotransferase